MFDSAQCLTVLSFFYSDCEYTVPSPSFLFTTCQSGAEQALKAELARTQPDFRFAFSRPGFVTFRLPDDSQLPLNFDLQSTFARTYGFSLDKVEGRDADEMAAKVWQLTGTDSIDHLHVWERDAAVPGDRGFEPGITALAQAIGEELRAACPGPIKAKPVPLNRVAKSGQTILDCVLVEPNEWWIGKHQAATPPSRWPGGICPLEVPEDIVSRAYLKMGEAVYWSRLPIERGDVAVELGSSPGGSCQALLDSGLKVVGVDPAEMEESLLEHPRFTHIRRRVSDVRRRDFRDARWLMADLNVAPQYTLDAIEPIVTYEDVRIRGMLITLKLLEWKLADQLPEYLARIRSWGFEFVKSRQLSFNRQEVCVLALRRRSMRRKPRKKKRRESPRAGSSSNDDNVSQS